MSLDQAFNQMFTVAPAHKCPVVSWVWAASLAANRERWPIPNGFTYPLYNGVEQPNDIAKLPKQSNKIR
jgi:hypothetical protein